MYEETGCHPPYHEWLGAALSHVPAAQPVLPLLAAALAAADAAGREAALCRVLDAGRFVTALVARE